MNIQILISGIGIAVFVSSAMPLLCMMGNSYHRLVAWLSLPIGHEAHHLIEQAGLFAIEANSQSYLAGFTSVFTSSAHPTVALIIMWVCLAGVGIIAAWMFVRSWVEATHAMEQRSLKAQKISEKQDTIPAALPH